MWEQARPRTPA